MLVACVVRERLLEREHILVREHILARYHFVAYACPQGLDLADPLSRCQKSSKVSAQALFLHKGTTKFEKGTFESVCLSRLRRSRARWNCWRLSPQFSKVSTQARGGGGGVRNRIVGACSRNFQKSVRSPCIEQIY
jgi:hypothetical protein